MPTEPEHPAENAIPAYMKMDFRSIDFPSDVLSVKRFRKLFPEHFDRDGLIVDGYANNDFFYPWAADDPPHLMRLTEMICDERTVAAGAYFGGLGDRYEINEEERESIDSSRKRLEELYQLFRLADSPETARLLIRQIEEQGKNQARQVPEVGR